MPHTSVVTRNCAVPSSVYRTTHALHTHDVSFHAMRHALVHTRSTPRPSMITAVRSTHVLRSPQTRTQTRRTRRDGRTHVPHATTAGKAKKTSSSKSASVPPPLPLPSSSNTQQTLARSFTISGVGLHTGETTVVTVKPASASSGRYFVRVPEGTNSGASYAAPKPSFVRTEQLDVNYGAEDGLDAEDRAQLFLQYMSTDGRPEDEEFGEYLQRHLDLPLDDLVLSTTTRPEEDPVSREEGEEVIEGEIGNAEVYGETTTLLRSASGNGYVMSPEALLSALEACGVDNARIEVEGGSEVPVADGSALTWALEVQKAGVRSVGVSGGSGGAEGAGEASRREFGKLTEMVTVMGGADRPGAFVSFYPMDNGSSIDDDGTRAEGGSSKHIDAHTTTITAGVDYMASSEAIGRQWVTWKTSDASPDDDFANHYRWVLAPARPVFPSYAAVEELFADGMIQAGPDGCCVIAEGDSWVDPNLVRFPLDEAARHAAQRLVGVLSMCAAPGGRGLPSGHIVSFDASPEMMIEFALKLKETRG